MNGTVQRISRETIFVNIGRAEGILTSAERVPGERFDVGKRIRVYIMDVKDTTKGPQIFLSRSHPGLVKKLFELEVPEIEDGIVTIKSIAREAGSRTKVAVYTDDENVDPVGACVGARGARVQSIVDELFGEKIDIIVWSDDPAELISNVLSPAKVEAVYLDEEEEKTATVVVPDYQLSLAIGKEGQNVRLAAKLCGWKIDIKSHTQYFGEDEPEDDEYAEEGYEDQEYEASEEYAEEEPEAAEEPSETEAEAEAEEEPAEETAEEEPAEAADAEVSEPAEEPAEDASEEQETEE